MVTPTPHGKSFSQAMTEKLFLTTALETLPPTAHGTTLGSTDVSSSLLPMVQHLSATSTMSTVCVSARPLVLPQLNITMWALSLPTWYRAMTSCTLPMMRQVLQVSTTTTRSITMVTDLYAHINDEDRRILAKKVDEQFFQEPQKKENPATADDTTIAFQLLRDNPDIAKLLIAALQKSSA